MYSEEAKKIINEIYRRKTGSGLKGCEDDKETKEAFSDLQRALQGALIELAVDLNTEETHFVLELIQNAEDNEYADNVIPHIKFTINESNVLVQNNEKGFNKENVEAICSVRESTKQKKYGYLGEKGIGFKSVFKITDEPRIFSNGFQFKFNHISKNGNLGFIVPYWIDEIPEMVDLNQTNILLPIREDAKKRLSQFRDIDPNFILFLKKLKRIEIVNECENTQSTVTKLEENKLAKVSSTQDTSYYKIIKKEFEVPTDIRGEKRKGVEKTEIILAFKVSQAGNPIIDSKQKVFSYLPIQDYGFKFIVQADFILTANRESITKDIIWNGWIRDKIHEVFLDSVDYFKRDEILRINYYKYIPVDEEINDGFFVPVIEKIYSLLNDYECILTESGSWAKPSNVIIIDQKLRNLVSNEDVKKLSGKEIVSSKIPRSSLPNKLEIETFKEKDFSKCLTETELIKSKSDEWLVSLYEHFLEKKEDVNDLKKLPIIKLNTGEFTHTEDMNIFFYLDKSGKNYGFEEDLINSIRILDHSLFESIKKSDNKNRILELLANLGIKNNDPFEIIEQYILPVYKDDTWKNKNHSILKGHIRYIKDNIKHYKKKKSSITELINLLYLRIKKKDEHTNYYAHPRSIYLSSEYGNKYDLDRLFSGLKEFMDNFLDISYLEDDYKKLNEEISKLKVKIDGKSKTWKKKHRKEVKRVEKQLSELEPKKGKIIGEWKAFFIELGVNESLKITETNSDFVCEDFNKLFENIDHFKYLEKRQSIKILLQTFSENWDNYQKYKLKKSSREASTFISQLRETPWIPTSDGSFARPTETFLPSPVNQELLGKHVKFFDSNICANTKEQFLKDLGIIFEPSILIVLNKLIDLSDKSIEDKDLIKKLYRYLDENFNNNPQLITDFFSRNKVIYDPTSHNYFTAAEVFWKDHSFIFGSTKAFLNENYNHLKTFFTNKLNIGIPKSKDYVDRLIQLSEEKPPQDEKSISNHDKIIWKIYQHLNDQMNPENVVTPISKTDWWKERKVENRCVLWTDKNNFWKNDSDVFVNDDEYLYSLFKDNEEVAFLKFSNDYIPRLKYFIQGFKIGSISKSVIIELLNVKGEKEDIFLTELLKGRVKYIERYLYFNDIETYKRLLNESYFSYLKNLVVYEVEKIVVKYILNEQEVKAERRKPLIHDKKMYILNSSKYIHLLGIELSEMTGGPKGLDDFLTLLFYQKEKEIEKLMISKRIGKIPSEDSEEDSVSLVDTNIKTDNILEVIDTPKNKSKANIILKTVDASAEDCMPRVDDKEENITEAADASEDDNMKEVEEDEIINELLSYRGSISGKSSKQRDPRRELHNETSSSYKKIINKTNNAESNEDPSEGNSPVIELNNERITSTREKTERNKEPSIWVKRLYGYNCQICLSKEEPAILAYPKSYASYNINRIFLMHAHHIKAVGDKGHDHPGNLLSLCKHHHNYIHQVGLTIDELDEALKTVIQKDISWPTGPKRRWNLLTLEDRHGKDDEILQIVMRTEHLDQLKIYIKIITSEK